MQSISITKLLKLLYGIDPSFTRFLTHKDVIGHFDGLEKVSRHDDDFVYKVESGNIVKVTDSKNNTEFYYISRPLLEEAEIQCEQNYDDLLTKTIQITEEDLEEMDIYELEKIRKKMKKDKRNISGCYDNHISNINREMRKRARIKRRRKK